MAPDLRASAKVASRADRMPARSSANAGFTLAELVVAIVILSVGVLAIASVMATVSQRRLRSTSRVEMTALAESKLEELRAYAMLNAAGLEQVAVGGSLTSSMEDHADTLSSPAGRPYIRRWQVQAVSGDTRSAMVRIEPLNETRIILPKLDFSTLLLVATP